LPTEVPAEDYDIVVFENKFPSLQQDSSEVTEKDPKFFKHGKAQGICEVVLFTSDHDGVMSEKPVNRDIKLVKVGGDRYQELGDKDYIDYVFIFENKGEEVGVTLHHPHGQIYAYPFIPPIIEQELDSSKEYLEKEGRCLFCKTLEEEKKDGRRIIVSNNSFTTLVPFSACYSYEVHIYANKHLSFYANKHLSSFNDFSEKEEIDLAAILKTLMMKFDNLFGFTLPYIMAIHQQPTNGTGKEYSHFHIEFYPPYRTKDKLKYLAGSELGVGVFINNSLPEEKAQELRNTPPEGVV
jgi:UDPglucose--hexose-1-phosphate uridylyltransferase